MIACASLTPVARNTYIRSDYHRHKTEAELTARLKMDVVIGRIEPLSWSARRLSDISVRLPRREREVFRCRSSIWREAPRTGRTAYQLSVRDGGLLLDDDALDRGDYAEVLRGGLGHDFAALGLTQIDLADLDVAWSRGRVALTANSCDGQIRFEDDGTGQASLMTHRLNGQEVGDSVHIVARFTPGQRITVHDLELSLPDAPLSVLMLDALLGGPVTAGQFSGRMAFRQAEAHDEVTLSGSVRGALLEELTRPLFGGPYRGRVDITLDEAVLAGRELTSLRFNGHLANLSGEQLGPALGVGPLSGSLELRVHQANYRDGAVQYLSTDGRATGIPLETLTSLWGGGRVTGTLHVEIHSLLIVDDRPLLAEATLTAVPPPDGPGTFDRALLAGASVKVLGFDATALLPSSVETVEYTRFGLRAELNRDLLTIRGTHGEDGKTILTVKLLGQEIGIVREPLSPYKVPDILQTMRQRWREQNVPWRPPWFPRRPDQPSND